MRLPASALARDPPYAYATPRCLGAKRPWPPFGVVRRGSYPVATLVNAEA